MTYEQWNARRRKDWPDAHHSAWSSEQVIDLSKGFELVADWTLNYIRDPRKGEYHVPHRSTQRNIQVGTCTLHTY